ncbi:site-specific DNA-methyltransferase [Pseudokineococcus basanitobsidens]|uniref:Site-specific DNA-methyltransferase n=1 Tax=Pseudokineococcus basanitobsidens TaxID=1926649 RepID=A0ABU8RGZ9_9ACTN
MPPRRRTDTPTGPVPVESFEHDAKRSNIPTADGRDFVDETVQAPRVLGVDRDTALDPQLVWRGKDEQDERLEVQAPPLYIQEKVDPRALVEELRRASATPAAEAPASLFDDFDGLEGFEAVEYYRHEANWSNRMILGDSLEVMASLAEREDLRGQVQCIYIDPPYGIKFQSNWQASTSKRDVKDGKLSDATREVEQIKAFRDTWELGIHSYLGYLRDRLTMARELLTDSGSVFVQIGDENAHTVRALLDEAFGRANFVSEITYVTTSGRSAQHLDQVSDRILWYAKDIDRSKVRHLWRSRSQKTLDEQYTMVDLADGTWRRSTREERRGEQPYPAASLRFMPDNMSSSGASSEGSQPVTVNGEVYSLPPNTHWKTHAEGMAQLARARRLVPVGRRLRYKRLMDDFPWGRYTNHWEDTVISGYNDAKVYVVQTLAKVIERCLLMTTDPGDLVLDPTCGSGTTATVAEQWGRRWITIDTSRVALALARQRIMGAQYPYYLLADSPAGRAKEAELTGERPPATTATGDLRQGFVYERVPHVTLKSIANNPDIREGMSRAEIDAAIARHAESETLYDRPYTDPKRVRVAGRFTVESLSPHRSVSFDREMDERPDSEATSDAGADVVDDRPSYERTVIDNLRTAGVQNGRKNERLLFESLEPHPGVAVQAVGTRRDADEATPQRIAVALGPEYGTVSPELVKQAAREALQGNGHDLLLVLGFSFDAGTLGTVDEFRPEAVTDESGDFATVAAERRLGRLPILLVRMNTDLAMGDELLKKTGAGNLFTVFGEPDVAVERDGDRVVVEIRGVDVYNPTTGEVRSDEPDSIALWMLDTDYDGESFFVRHAYFCGAGDPYARLKRSLKADVDEAAWESLNSTRSRPFPVPSTGRIAVKAINDYGDEVLTALSVT